MDIGPAVKKYTVIPLDAPVSAPEPQVAPPPAPSEREPVTKPAERENV